MSTSAKSRRKNPGKAKPAKPRRLSRPTLNIMLRDLSGRLDQLEWEAEAFAAMIKPNDQHTVTETQIRQACGVMLSSLQGRIRDAHAFASTLEGRS